MKSKYLTRIGAIILFLTALFHSTGIAMVNKAQPQAMDHLPSMLAQALPVLWLSPGFHWIFLAILAFFCNPNEKGFSRLFLKLLAVLLLVDATLLTVHIGPFIGAGLLAACSVCFFVCLASKQD